jgi:hypothetical protein
MNGTRAPQRVVVDVRFIHATYGRHEQADLLVRFIRGAPDLNDLPGVVVPFRRGA